MPNPHPDPQPRRAWHPALALAAPLTSIFLPALTARRLDRAPLPLCYAAHLAGAFMATALVFVLIAWAASPTPSVAAGVLAGELLELWREMAEEVDRDPRIVLAYVMAAASIMGLVEGGTVLVAWSMMAWSAGPEPWAAAFRRSLCRAWLVTGHAVFYLLVFVAPLVWQSRLWDTYWDRYSGTHHGPKDPPWWLEHSEYLGLLGWLVAAATLCVVLLRAWARPGWRACCRWPAGCEGCGYDLQGVPAAGNCPECGKPIAESTVATRRDRGPARGGLVTLGDWFWCNGLALVRPKLLGGRLMTLSPSRGRAVLFAVTAAGVAGVATVGALTMTCVEMIRWEYAPDLEELVMTGTIAASASVLVTLLATLAGASVVGTSARLHTKRDLMPLAMDGALSLGGFWIIGHAVFWCVMVGVYLVTEVFEWIDTYSAMRVMLIGAVMLGTPLVLLVVYLMLLGRIVWAGRHANT